MIAATITVKIPSDHGHELRAAHNVATIVSPAKTAVSEYRSFMTVLPPQPKGLAVHKFTLSLYQVVLRHPLQPARNIRSSRAQPCQHGRILGHLTCCHFGTRHDCKLRAFGLRLAEPPKCPESVRLAERSDKHSLLGRKLRLYLSGASVHHRKDTWEIHRVPIGVNLADGR
jgi:hypothetical protein